MGFITDLTNLLESSTLIMKNPPKQKPSQDVKSTTQKPETAAALGKAADASLKSRYVTDSSPISAITAPDDPTSLAFWIAEGRYRKLVYSDRVSAANEAKLKDGDYQEQQEKKKRRKLEFGWHPSKAYWMEIGGIQKDQTQSLEGEVQQEAKESEMDLEKEKAIVGKVRQEEAEEQKRKKTAADDEVKIISRKQPVYYDEPIGVDVTMSLLVKEPPPPSEPRHVRRYHHHLFYSTKCD